MNTYTCDSAIKCAMLKKAPCFHAVADADLLRLAELAQARNYEANELLFLQGQSAQGFFVLATGTIAVYRSGPDGKRQILHLFDTPGDLCGEVPVFEGDKYPASAECTEAGRLLYLRRGDFLDAARQQPEILLAMLATLSRRLRRFVELIEDLSLKSVSTRLAAHLLELCVRADLETFALGTGKAVLAEKLGTIPETISRTLRKFQEQGVIAVANRTITVKDRDALARLAME